MADPVVRLRPRIYARAKEEAEADGVTLKAWVEKVVLAELEKRALKARPRWPVLPCGE